MRRALILSAVVAAFGAVADAEADADNDLLLDGFRAYHSVCNHCHGPDGLGSSFGPGLVDAPPDAQAFIAVIRDGAAGPRGVMKGFGDNPAVMARADAILAYIDARSRGTLGRGRPGR